MRCPPTGSSGFPCLVLLLQGADLYAGPSNTVILQPGGSNLDILKDTVVWSRVHCVIGETLQGLCRKCGVGMYSLNPKNRTCDIAPCGSAAVNCTGGDKLIPMQVDLACCQSLIALQGGNHGENCLCVTS